VRILFLFAPMLYGEGHKSKVPLRERVCAVCMTCTCFVYSEKPPPDIFGSGAIRLVAWRSW